MSGKVSNKIVTDGLVLYLDFANPKSYIDGDTICNDLTYYGNIGTLTNGPTYSSNYNGILMFDGVNDYITIPNSPNFSFSTGDMTIDFWLYLNGSQDFCVFDNEGAGGASQVSRISGDFYFAYNTFNVNPTDPWSYTVPQNQWVNICLSKTSNSLSLYSNSVLIQTRNSIGSIGNGANTNRIGYRTDGYYPLNGNLSNIKIYKGKGLTQSEVLQNYNALKTRFSL